MIIRPIRFILFCFSLLFLVSSCKRINEATDLGGEIIPEVDGVNTFDTTLTSLETYNHIFEADKDSIRVTRNEDHILGNIINDPLFGPTNARMFLDLKPELFPWSFSGIYNKDSLQIDSVVLVLGWKDTYGDTVAPQKVNVWEIDPNAEFRRDSFYTIRDPGFAHTTFLGTKTFKPENLKDSIKAFKDTTAGQLRIRLDNNFGRRLLDYDTTNAYKTDSAFKTYFNGFEIEADQSMGNALMAFGITDNPNTKLAIYYQYRKDGQWHPTVDYFSFKITSANHNYVNRFNFTGTPLKAASTTPGEDNPLYIINTPGSYATVKIPALRDMSNRIINRAELIVEQLYDPSNDKFIAPDALMLDVYDTVLKSYKFVPFDFTPDTRSLFPNASFGLYGKTTVNAAGNPIKIWKFNLTRYVQNVLTKQEPLHDLRLYISKDSYSAIRQGVASNTGPYIYPDPGIIINLQHVFGRVMIGGGKHPTQTMRLRIVYTKI